MSALRELLVFFGTEVDTAPLEKADDLVDKVKKGLVGLAAGFSIAWMANEFKQVVNLGDEIGDTAQKLGFSTKSLQEWRHVAGITSLEAGALEGSIRKANLAIADAAGGGEKAKSFSDLGVALRDASGAARTVDDIFADTITRLAAIPDRAKRAAASSDLFGKSFTELNPILDLGAEGVAKLRGELSALDGVVSDAAINASSDLNDELTRMSAAATGLKASVIGLLAPAIIPMITWVTRALPKVQKLGSDFKEWVKTSQPLRNALRFVGTLLGVVAMKSAPGLLAKGVGLLAGKWGVVRGVLTRVAAVLWRFIARMMIPAFILDDLIVTFKGGDSVIRRIIDGWFGEGTTAQVVNWFKGFFTGLDGLKDRFGGLFEFFGALLATAAFEAKAAFIGIGTTVMDAVRGGWNSLVQAAEDGLNRLIEIANKIPGLNLDKADLSGGKRSTDNNEIATRALEGERMGVAQRLAGSADRAFGTRIADVQAPVTINLPPGTPEKMAERVATATARATKQGMKASMAALKQKKA